MGHKFKDTAGREWEVGITVADLKRLRAVGVEMKTLLADRLRGLLELAEDPERFVAGVFALVADKADRAGVSEEDFGRSMAGDALAAAWDAFVAAVADFCPSRKREVLTALVKKTKDIEANLTREAVEGLAKIDPKRAARALAAASAPSSGGRGNSPASPDSTPAG